MRLRAVLLILVAAAALVVLAAGGFYLLSDAERVRRTAETSLSQALDRDVRLQGAIGLRFLPTPQAIIADPTVVAEDSGQQLAEADRIDLLLSPVALLTGNDPVASLTVVRPVLAAPVVPHELFRLVHGIGVGSIRIVDGRVSFQAVPDAPVLGLTGLNLERTRDEAGETRMELQARDDSGGGSQPFAFAGSFRGADGSGGVPAEVSLTLGTPGSELRAGFQGLIGLDRLFGRVEIDTSRPLPAWLGDAARFAPAGPWRAEARLDVSPARISIPELAAAAGEASVGGELELDRATARGSARLELHDAALDILGDALVLPAGYSVTLRLAGRDLAVRGVAVPNLDLEGLLEPDGRLALMQVSATVAANGAFRLRDGQFTGGADPMLTGLVSLDLPTARTVLPQLFTLPAWLPPDKPGALLAEGRVQWSPGRILLDEAEVRADQLGYRGRIALGPDRVGLVGTFDRLDLDEWWNGPSDPATILAALPDGSADIRIDRLSRGAAWIQDVAVEASRAGGRLVIAEASAGASDDLRLTLAGTIGSDAGVVDVVVDLDAKRPARIASLLEIDLPWLSRLQEVEGTASLRGPSDRLDIDIEARSGDRRVQVAGLLGSGTRADATSLRLRGDAPDLAALLGDLALLPLAPSALRGPVEVTADLSRTAEGHWVALTDLRAGPLQTTSRLDLRLTGGIPRVAGQIAVAPMAEDAVPAIYDMLSTGLAFAPGSPLRWPGSWPQDQLRFAWLFSTELDLIVRREGAQERSGLLALQLADGRLDLERLDLDLPTGGRLRGQIGLDGNGEVPRLGLSLTLDELDSAAAGALLGIGRAPDTRLAAEIDLAGAGTSVAAMVQSLAGTLRLATGAGSIPPPAGSLAEPFTFASIQGAIAFERGLARSETPGLALDMPDGTRRYLDAMLDLPVWFLDAVLPPEADRPGWHLLGPPGRLQFREISPTDPASAPDAPDGRTPLPSGAPAPAPIP
ncbi:MAG TPA: AsmA-like C-terminal region-containing protein [Geminicoccus sp.]|jgi:hypothetical protein|uniref:AsmA-like C-terminal region-containing protein n=1 Tax=Geminicoccus sp. TaxID=2024832 RepID=UPI002E2F732E|nr:AsmA-like C-terminal region-containing protein [Geminicoccus sp.]HEX2524799.1 AsmA-like C-terminal region-containing protein [Geminicoccus sp.]